MRISDRRGLISSSRGLTVSRSWGAAMRKGQRLEVRAARHEEARKQRIESRDEVEIRAATPTKIGESGWVGINLLLRSMRKGSGCS